MIPTVNDELRQDFEIEKQPTKTYYLNIEKNKIDGFCNGLEAMQQAIYKIINTERFDYLIYSWNYGIEMKNLIGEPTSYVVPELERIIKEALVQDDRIIDVTNFEFEKSGKNILITFLVETTEGELSVEKVVDILSG